MLETPCSLRGMVTSPHHLASQAGLDVLKDGGNAVEAGVAMAAALAVVYPHMTGIGGDGFWLVAEPDGEVWGMDACGRAAAAADLAFYAGHEAIPQRGPLAANTVAGTVSGWGAALAKVGSSLPLDRLLRDAIHHAEAGAPVTRSFAENLAAKGSAMAHLPGFAEACRAQSASCVSRSWPRHSVVSPPRERMDSIAARWRRISPPISARWAARSLPPISPCTMR